LSRELDGVVLVAFDGVGNIGVPWLTVVDDHCNLQLTNGEKPVSQ